MTAVFFWSFFQGDAWRALKPFHKNHVHQIVKNWGDSEVKSRNMAATGGDKRIRGMARRGVKP